MVGPPPVIPPPDQIDGDPVEPSPRRAQIATAVIYLIILGVVALISARAASYDQQIANLRQEVNTLETELESEIARLDALNLQNQKDFRELSERVSNLEGARNAG